MHIAGGPKMGQVTNIALHLCPHFYPHKDLLDWGEWVSVVSIKGNEWEDDINLIFLSMFHKLLFYKICS